MPEKQIIWEAGLDDDAYLVKVERLDDIYGQLIVTEAATSKEVMSEKVGLSYGAKFGPDYADSLNWQEMVAKRIPPPA